MTGFAGRSMFYDQHPFDWIERYSPQEVRSVISPVLLQLVDSLAQESIVLDVGCGAGRVMSYLGFRGLRCIGFDRSLNSVSIMVDRFRRPGVVADNLCLPVRDGIADLVVSDGVVHHTDDPYKAFFENCRILKSGGLLYLAVYKPGKRYEFLYRHPGRIIRTALRYSITRFLVHLTALPLYYTVRLLKSSGRITWSGATNLFYDYFASPQVVFLLRERIEQWCRENNMAIRAYDANPGGNVQCFVLQKLVEK